MDDSQIERQDKKIIIPQPKYYCKVCDYSAQGAKALVQHKDSLSCQRKHIARDGLEGSKEPVKKYKCKMCPKTLASKQQLRIHLERNNCKKPPRIYSCDTCDRKFSHKKTYLDHLGSLKCKRKRKEAGESVKIKGDYRCPTCPKSYAKKQDLKKHLEGNKCPKTKNENDVDTESEEEKTNAESGKYKCIPCNMPFKRSDSLNKHFRSINCRQKRIELGVPLTFEKCVCSKMFPTRDSLIKHARRSKCPISEEIIDRPRKRKERRRKSKKPVDCGPELEKKVPDFAEEEQGKYHCKICDLSFNWKSNYVRHMQTPVCKQNHVFHLQKNENLKGLPLQRIFPCRWCDAMFSTQLEVVEDMETFHTTKIPKDKLAEPRGPHLQLVPDTPEPYSCYICLKTFRKASGAYDCIFLCERRIGLSKDGFVNPLFR